MKKVVILGSTGSIGKSALEVLLQCREQGHELLPVGIGCFENAELLLEQARIHRTGAAALIKPGKILRKVLNLTLFAGDNSFEDLIDFSEPDIVLNAVSGSAGLRYTRYILEKGIDVALANKESLIMGGSFILDLAERTGAALIPVDSEHSAIFQLLNQRRLKDIEKIYITGSGGPFLKRKSETFDDITPEEALSHPRWRMGNKITVDSATLMNKGLEVLEAYYLFGVDTEKIKVIIHPESVIHGMIEMVDGSVYAQMASPDMKGPISYAFLRETRLGNLMEPVDFIKAGSLNFLAPDYKRFPLLKLAFDVAGKTAATIAMNTSGEVSVYRFLRREIKFPEISETVLRSVDKFSTFSVKSFEDIFELDRGVRDFLSEGKRHRNNI